MNLDSLLYASTWLLSRERSEFAADYEQNATDVLNSSWTPGLDLNSGPTAVMWVMRRNGYPTTSLLDLSAGDSTLGLNKEARMDDLFKILAMAVGLGMDAMSVCMAVGVKWHGPRQRLRLAWHMGLFQFLMPIIGWLVGSALADVMFGYCRFLAAGLVFAVGVKMLYEAVKSHPGLVAEAAEHAAEKELHMRVSDPTRGLSLVMLSIATSIDALVVGFSLALRDERIVLPSVIIGVVAGTMAFAGVAVGRRVGKALGRWAEVVGALVLMGLGVCFLLV